MAPLPNPPHKGEGILPALAAKIVLLIEEYFNLPLTMRGGSVRDFSGFRFI